ncbi:MAG: radical SAM protein [Ruminococcus flavefaciens]|nr:radical SAM protein [Ruminococcus flavefaciens]
MGLFNIKAQYKAYMAGVHHCTFNPAGPGVVRIHLIPPKFSFFGRKPYIVILNGYYLLPLGYSWAVMLSLFMDEVNNFDGRPINDNDWENIAINTIKNMKKAYPFTDEESLRMDLKEMTEILFSIAKGNTVDAEIERLSIRAYSSNMSAPHRMDLMISAMTDSCGNWQCNQKCRFCYAAGQKLSASKELSTEEWKTAITKLRKSGVPMITFTGGEPTLRADLIELIDYARWFVTRLNTNGVALTSELCEQLKNASLDSVQITLYSHSKEIHNKLTGSNHFYDTVQGIKNAVQTGLDVSINTPLCSLNSDYVNTLKFVHELGVRYVTVSGLICTGTAESVHSNYDLESDLLFDSVKKAKDFCDENGMEIDFTSPGLIEHEQLETLGMNVPSCGAALSNMAIAPDGTVIPCQSWLGSDASLGNILTDKFSNIWENEKCLKLRKMTDSQALCCPFRKGDVHNG